MSWGTGLWPSSQAVGGRGGRGAVRHQGGVRLSGLRNTRDGDADDNNGERLRTRRGVGRKGTGYHVRRAAEHPSVLRLGDRNLSTSA